MQWVGKSYQKEGEVFTWIKDKHDVKIICLQETHYTPDQETQWKSEWEGNIYFSHGISNSRGVMIMFKKDLVYTVHNAQSDTEGRWLILDLKIDDLNIQLINIYAQMKIAQYFLEI